MPACSLRSLLIALVMLCAACGAITLAGQPTSPHRPPATLVIANLGNGTAPLDGPWQFHLGDNPAWADPKFDDTQWEQLDPGKPWGAQGHFDYTGFAWYRRSLDLSPVPGASPDFALLVPQIDDAFELYWNGRRVGGYGKLPPRPVWYTRSPAQTFELGPIRAGVFAIRVWKAPLMSRDSGDTGGMASPPVVGSVQGIAGLKARLDSAWFRKQTFVIALYSLYGLLALLGLIIWLHDRTQWLLFWTTSFLAAVFVEVLVSDLHLPIPTNVSVGVGQLADAAVNNIAMWYLLCWLLDLRGMRSLMRITRIAAWILLSAAVLEFLIDTFGWTSRWALAAQIGQAAATTIVVVLEAYNLVPVAVAILKKQKVDHSRWLVAGGASVAQFLNLFWIATSEGNRFTHWTLSQKIVASLFTLGGTEVQIQGVADSFMLIALVYAIYRYSIETSSRKNILEQEFRNARELQQVLIPEEMPEIPGFALTSAYKPAQEVGGDFFQIVSLESGSTLVVLGDVSGKGLKAAMAVSLIVGAIRTLAETTPSPAEVLAGLNRRLNGRLQGGFTTCIALCLESDGRCVIASAGHPAPFLNGHELVLPGSLPLGLVSAAAYEETTIQLSPTDRLALYTDGLLEARSPSGELYSFARLKALFAADPTAAEATEAAVAFGQDDDITVLTLTRLEPGQESIALRVAPALA